MLESLSEFYGSRFDEALSRSLSRIRAHSQPTFQGDYLIYNMPFSSNAYTSEIVIGIFGYFLTRRETARFFGYLRESSRPLLALNSEEYSEDY
jgi:hypothetical protein